MSVAELLAPLDGRTGPIHLPAAHEWMQGRTLYGGASALLAYTAAIRAFPDLPPLRAGQVAFVGPVGETVEFRTEIVRAGRNVVQVRSELLCENAVALSAFWLFGTAREPNALHSPAALDSWPDLPEESLGSDKAPAFIANNFELRRAQEGRGPGTPVVRRWLRLREPTGLDPVSDLVLLGDTLPPGAMRAMQRLGPISSINWSFNILDPEPQTRDGWWLGETASEWADHGYSSERLRMWSADGRQVLSGMQSVAVFG
ncbi:MAG: acyl-CoA thioesterase [Sphingomonadaceae bacterium]